MPDQSPIDPVALCERFHLQHRIDLCPDLIETGRPELTTEHETMLAIEHGEHALVRYYSPLDPFLPENAAVPAGTVTA